jgi:signal transduction histidine kinase
LAGASDTLLATLAPIGTFLQPDIELGLGLAEEVTADRIERLDSRSALFGYRAATDDRGEHVVLAAPAGTDVVEDAVLTRRRDDLSILLMFATVVGAVSALGLSGLAARQFARPIDALRRAALAAAAGAREPDLGGEPPAEFIPVFSAFRRMAADFGASQRVLAWGQMARQVAHEIKNPLTPIRLGVQHLLRAHADKRKDFDRILQQNVGRILAEIDRLDEIARAFSRYGTAPEERPPAEPTDVGAVVRDVVELERLGAEGGITWSVSGLDNGALIARARADDLREVLLNLLENARLAHAHSVKVSAARDSARVIVSVEDDGEGIPADVMPRIFEPHFSTRTSGSGLGLAVSRRLVDGWGGAIAVQSQRDKGTVVTVTLVAS